jgi:hypothetical protein
VRQHHAACITLIGVSVAQAVKAAKLGVLTAGTEDGVTTLTCIFDSEA